MRKIPYFPSVNDDFCGPAVLQMALGAFGITATQKELTEKAETPRTPDAGTAPEVIVRVLKEYGLHTIAHEQVHAA